MGDLITVNYEVHDGDVTGYFLVPMPKIGIWEVLQVDCVHGWWQVTNPSASASRNWVGRAENRQEAILDYLKARLGVGYE
jgi:hypothetical protein